MAQEDKVINRRRVLQSAAAGVAAASFGGIMRPAFAAPKTIKIGLVMPSTGPLAFFTEHIPFTLNQVRKTLGGKIKINGTVYPYEIIIKDSQSNPNRASEVTQELILKDKVNLVAAFATPETVNPVSDQCEVNGVPCITNDAPLEPYFFGRKGDPKKGFDWTAHFFWGVDDIANVFANLWDSLDTNKTVGALWSNDPDGIAVSDQKTGFPPLLKARGFKLVDLGLYPTMSDDFSAQINALKAAKADIVTGVFVPPAFATFWTQSAQQGYRPKAATPAKALLFPTAVEALGDRGVNLSTEVWWSPHHPFKSGLTGETPQQFCDAYTKSTNRQWTQPIGFKHATLEVAIDVLRRAKAVDPKSIRDAIFTTNCNTIVGPVNFSNGPVKGVSRTPLVGGQWKRGTKWKYDLTIVNNKTAPNIPTGGKVEPIG